VVNVTDVLSIVDINLRFRPWRNGGIVGGTCLGLLRTSVRQLRV